MWVALLIARVASWSLGVAPTSDPAYEFLLQRSSGTAESLLLLVLAFVAAQLVHEEPLVGWNAFWYTRPYSRHSLMLAKVLLAAGMFVALPLLADVATMTMYHLGLRAQLEALASFITGYVTWLLLAIAMAALTPSLAVFVLTTVASFTVLSLITMTINAAWAFLRDPNALILPTPGINPVPGVIATLLVDAAMVGVIVYQYTKRRWRPAAALAAVGIVASVAAAWFPLGGPPAPDLGPWAADPAASPVVVERGSQTRTAFRDDALRRLVYAPVRLDGVPEDHNYGFDYSTILDSTLTLSDGTRVSSRLRESIAAPIPDPKWHGFLAARRAALGAALGEVTLIAGANETDVRYWPAVIALSGQQYARLRGTSGRLDATVRFILNKSQQRATLPLDAGAAHEDGSSRVEVIRVERRADGMAVTIRQSTGYSPLATRRRGGFSFALYNRSRGEALTPIKRTQLPTPAGTQNVSSGFPVLSLMGAMSGGLRYAGLSMDAAQYLFPDRIERPGVSQSFDPGWFDGASLAVLESSYAGTVTRSVTVEDFKIPEE